MFVIRPNRETTPSITVQDSYVTVTGFKTHNHLFCKRTLNHSAKVERFKDILELSNGIKPDDLIYYFSGSTTRKIFDDFDNAIKLFQKIKSGDLMLEY